MQNVTSLPQGSRSKLTTIGLRRPKSICGNYGGFALILVLGALSIIAVILVGFTLAMQLERQASESSYASLNSDAMVQAALGHATALLAQNIPPVANGTTLLSINNTSATNWWVNPGLLSTQCNSINGGAPVYVPLYTTPSAATLAPPNAQTFNGSSYPPTDTQPQTTTDTAGAPAQGVDLNRPNLNNPAGFPPTPRTITGYDPVVSANNAPMQVYWQYVVQDPTKPHNSTTNPYVGRYAFWMEPENSKIDFTMALGKLASPASNIPDVAPTYSNNGTPNYNNVTFTANGIGANGMPNYGFVLSNPCSVDLSVLTGASQLNLNNLFNAQQYIVRGNTFVGPTYGINNSNPFNQLPLAGATGANAIPPTFDDVEQIKNFMSAGTTSAAAETFYQHNKFYLTNYSRDPEFNVFGGSRIFPSDYDGTSNQSWYGVYDINPAYQYFWNVREPLWIDVGDTYAKGTTNTNEQPELGRTYGSLLYLSQMMQRTDWPGYSGSMASKWNSTSPAREADQVAWNMYGNLSLFQDFYNGGYPANNFGGSQGKFYLCQGGSGLTGPNTIDVPDSSSTDIPPQVRYPLGSALWSGTQVGSRYSAQGTSLTCDEIGLVISASPAAGGVNHLHLVFQVKADLEVPSGYSNQASIPLTVSTGSSTNATTLVISHLEYLVNGTKVVATPSVLFGTGADVGYENAPLGNSQSGVGCPLALSAISGASTITPGAGPVTVNSTGSYTDPANYVGPVTLTNIKVKFAVYQQDFSKPLQVSPLPASSTTVGSSVPPVGMAATDGNLELETASTPACITFPMTTVVTRNGATVTVTPSATIGMAIDDPRLSINADKATTGLPDGWVPDADGSKFGLTKLPSPIPPFSSTDPSKLALSPLGSENNYYLDPGFNGYNYLSPGMLFYACTGMQAGKPWQTLSLRPGGGNAAALTAARSVSPPDYLLLDLLQAPYRYTTMNSAQGKININSRIFPTYFGMSRTLPLQALFTNINVAGKPINSSNVGTLVQAIQNEESTLQGFRYTGELCEVGALGTAVGQLSSPYQFQQEALMRNLSGLITTRSNSFGLWGAAETVKEQANGQLTTLSDKRFHATIERYVWPGCDGFYGNAFVDQTTGTYTRSTAGPGDPTDQLDGPDGIGGTNPLPPQIFPGANNANIPLNMNLPLTNPQTSLNPLSNITYTNTPLEKASNPLSPYMRYRIVNFRYITD